MATAPTRPEDAAPARPAATIVLLRDQPDQPAGPEVLLLRRSSRSGFAASAWVFPGGVVDRTDAAVPDGTWTGIDPEALAPAFDLPPGEVLALHVAAIRETFEEAGLLLATRADGSPPDLADPALEDARRLLNDRDAHLDWGAFCADHGLVMQLGAVAYLAHWITPIQEPRRYDTRFFLAAVPPGAEAAPDDVETTQARWLTPRAALDDDDVAMIFPTIRTLEGLLDVRSADEAVARARALPAVTTVQPHIVLDDDGRPTDIILPDDPRYPHEVYR